jgi:putative transcriptional regulator
MAQSDTFSNQFLVALTSLSGDYFQKTLTLIIDHSEKGAFGLVINRPLEHTIFDVFPDLPEQIDCPLLEGGPVEQDKMFFLHGGDETFESTLSVAPGLSITTSRDLVDALHKGQQPSPIVALLGYAGWGPDQLERELGENTWLLTPSNEQILFNTPIEERAAEAAKLLGVDLNLIATRAGHD